MITSTACGGSFTSLNGNLTSPGYPNSNYPDNANCRYEIRVPRDRRIYLRINELDLEQCCDRLFVMEMRSGSLVQRAVLTGYLNTSTTFISSENVIILVFTSDGSVTYTGFTASYHTINSGKLNKIFI